MKLLPKFNDRSTCLICEAPAEIIGHPGEGWGSRNGFVSEPIKTRNGTTLTHLCTRVSTPENYYECGALPATKVRTVAERELPAECFEGASGETSVQAEMQNEIERVRDLVRQVTR